MVFLKNLACKISFVIFAFSIVGCMTYRDVEMIEVTDVGVKDFTAKGVEVEVAMQIKNPNNYNISIVDSDLTLFAQGNKVGTANIENKVTLPKKSNQIHRFTITSSLKDMGSSAFPLLMTVMGGEPIELQITGDIKAKAKGIGKRFPVDFKEKVTL
ncbi:MAG: LEA type 2 family protein [Vicingaceae bacterium]|nr:LEA type 2 family protein [Vicingaceae bacterium]